MGRRAGVDRPFADRCEISIESFRHDGLLARIFVRRVVILRFRADQEKVATTERGERDGTVRDVYPHGARLVLRLDDELGRASAA